MSTRGLTAYRQRWQFHLPLLEINFNRFAISIAAVLHSYARNDTYFYYSKFFEKRKSFFKIFFSIVIFVQVAQKKKDNFFEKVYSIFLRSVV